MSAYTDDDDIINAKVVLLGSAGVGKTCLVIKYKTGNFPNMPTPTIGASYTAKTVQVKSRNIKLQMWDTAGQERFASMAAMYYRGADAAILVFDITDPKSLQNCKKWVKELSEHHDVGDDIVLVLCANKTDLPRAQNEASKALMSEAKEYAQSISAKLFLTSAKTSQGINEMFDFVANAIFKAKLENGSLGDTKDGGLILNDPQKKSKCCSLI